MNNQNNSMFKVKKALKNKNTVTVICVLLVVVILLGGYQMRVNGAIQPTTVYYALETIQPRRQITENLIGQKKVAAAAIESTVITNKADIINMYSNYNTMIPKGSMFYKGTVVDKNELPDVALLGMPDGYTLGYITVTMLTSYTSSILPDNYIDIYVSTRDPNGKALVGKLFSNIKVKAVKTSDGLNVFENSDERRVPSIVQFAIPDEQFLLLKRIDTINNFGIDSRITLIPVPNDQKYKNPDGEVTPEVDSKYLEDYIINLSNEKVGE